MYDLWRFAESIIKEDITDPGGQIPTGDHSSLAAIPEGSTNQAQLVMKDAGIIAGLKVAEAIFLYVDESLVFQFFKSDGDRADSGDVVFTVEGNARSILTAERPALNMMQRMSGIATITNRYVKTIKGTGVKVLDTRKTTPGLRYFEKQAVKLGGGENHRYGLFDMIMLKDNHIDFAGGIAKAIDRVEAYLKEKDLSLPIEVEVRNFDELQKVLDRGGVNRVMLDNFSPEEVEKAVAMVDKRLEVEVSGGITLETIRSYAVSGVDFISVGALTHSVKSLDMSLKSL